MKHTMPDKNLAGKTTAKINSTSKPRGFRNKFASRSNRLDLCLALVCLGLLFAIYPFSVEGKKENAQGKVADVQVQGTPITGVTTAVVNFEELAAGFESSGIRTCAKGRDATAQY